MAEGISNSPDEVKSASSEASATKRPEAAERLKGMMGELFKSKTDKESDEDDDEESTDSKEKSSTKNSRFGKAWRSLFPKVATKEDVGQKQTDNKDQLIPKGIFYGTDSNQAAPDVVTSEVAISAEAPLIDGASEQAAGQLHQQVAELNTSEHIEQPRPQATSEASVQSIPLQESEVVRPIQATAESIPKAPETTSSRSPEVTTSVTTAGATAEMPQPVQLAPEAVNIAREQHMRSTESIANDPARYSIESAPAFVTPSSPERVVVNGISATDHLRLLQMERREKDIEKQTRFIKKEIENRPLTPNALRPRPESVASILRAPERTTETRIEHREVVNTPSVLEIQKVMMQKNTEKLKQIQTAEQEQIVQKTVEAQNSFKDHKERIIEKIYDKVNTKEVEEHKEITYELSHEAKDMDKQTAAQWAAIQASAEAQAKANAAAIAAANNAVGSQAADIKQIAKNQSVANYQQAALGGFVAAVVIIAIIIAILLLS